MEGALERWCVTFLGSAPASELFRTGHLSEVVAVALADGREVIIKIRAPSRRLAASVQVQRHLHSRGYPCPDVLAGPEPFGELMATAETHVPAHGTPPEPPPPEPTAQLLAALVDSAPPANDFPALNPAPPWVGWDHPGESLWPWPDDLDFDLNRHPGPDWIDDTAQRIRARLAAETSPAVIGHIDWEAHNLDWDGTTPVVVHDWDSVAIRVEAGIAGAAAIVYPSNGTTAVAATIEQTGSFLDAYARARPSQWSSRANETAWCAGLWVITYNAKKETLGGGTGYLEHLGREHAERCSLAGI
ncbi:MAG: hypothetical protein E6G06_01340 [Actinobacteria bacterium]|nr:MAG: hypothetical protein E6G06_01340 [Actinomycetota bacterium]